MAMSIWRPFANTIIAGQLVLDAPTAAVLAAAIGGLAGLSSSTVALVLSSRNIDKQSKMEIRKVEMSGLLSKRQSALEILYVTLTEYHDFSQISDAERRSFISATLWVPPRLRASCLHALANKGAGDLSAARSELIGHLSTRE